MEIFFYTISETFNNTFIGTLSAGILIGYFSINYFYRKQGFIDINHTARKTFSELLIDIKKEMILLYNDKELLDTFQKEPKKLIELEGKYADFTKRIFENYNFKKIREILARIERVTAGTEEYKVYLSIKHDLEETFYPILLIKMDIIDDKKTIPQDKYANLSKVFEKRYEKISKELETHINK